MNINRIWTLTTTYLIYLLVTDLYKTNKTESVGTYLSNIVLLNLCFDNMRQATCLKDEVLKFQSSPDAITNNFDNIDRGIW